MGNNDYFIGKDIGQLQAEVARLRSGGCNCGSKSKADRDLTEAERENLAKVCVASADLRAEFNKIIKGRGLDLQIADFGLVAISSPTSNSEKICACCPGLGPGNASYRCCFVAGCDPCDVSISLPDHDEGPGPG